MEELVQMKCVACRKGAPTVTEKEIAEFIQQLHEWGIVEHDGIKRVERPFRFDNFSQALSFTNKVGELAEVEGHHPALLTEWGKSNGYLVDAQNQRVASQRFRHGSKNRSIVLEFRHEERNALFS